MKCTGKLGLCFVVALASSIAHAEALKFEVIEIAPSVNPNLSIRLNSLNDNGQVVGTIRSDQNDPLKTYVWDMKTGFEVFDENVNPWAINNVGQIVALFGNVYDSDLSLLYSDTSHYVTWGSDINNYGQVLGLYKHESFDDLTRAFVWDSVSGPQDIGDLGYGETHATAMNDAGFAVGTSSVTFLKREAFIWSKDSGMKSLGSLAGYEEGLIWSWARDINNSNQVVGETDYGYTAKHAFIWTEETGMIDLGSLADDSYAVAINDDGLVIGNSFDFSDSTHTPFLWSDTLGMVDIHSLLAEEFQGYQIRRVNALNNNNQILADATYNNQHYYVLLNPVPEPATLMLLLMGGGLAIRRRRHVGDEDMLQPGMRLRMP